MIIAYTRTYSNKQQSDNQKNAIEQFAANNNMTIDKWHKDTRTTSSRHKNRLEDIIKNMEAGDTLIVADVTRLSRRLMEIMHLILLCIEKKITLYCLKEGYTFENNVDSKTLAFTFGLVSEIESKLISTRTKESLEITRSRGTTLGRPKGTPKMDHLLAQKEQIEKELNEENAQARLKDLHGILVAPGFGHRGIAGKLIAIEYARTNNIPFFGICLGMQMAVIEFARNVLHMEGADSTEMAAKTKYPVIDLMDSQQGITDKGGTMRLGAYRCELREGSKAYEAYGEKEIRERHRHRYEFNSAYREEFEKAGMVTTGINPESGLTEIVEIPSHKWFVGVQFHPEYRSTVIKPHPLFIAFIKACLS